MCYSALNTVHARFCTLLGVIPPPPQECQKAATTLSLAFETSPTQAEEQSESERALLVIWAGMAC